MIYRNHILQRYGVFLYIGYYSVPPPLAGSWRGRAFACIFFVSDNHKRPSLTATGRPLATNHKKGCRLNP
ncbi:MAG: hypothetical protein LBQ31_00400 [Bacteroidales bacterium]|nr:hypothetical protein [Bacteroidales bacterium]